MANRATVLACSRLLDPFAIRLKSSQLTRGVASDSHACLRLLCLMSCSVVMFKLYVVKVESATLIL